MDTGWGVFCILPMIGSGVLYYNYLIYIKNGDFSALALTGIFVILMMATVFYVFNYVLQQLHEKYQVLEQKRILDLQNKAQLDQFERHREVAEKTNRRWHDLRHSIQQLIDFLEDGNTEMAISYLKEQRGVDILQKEVYCFHSGVNSILCLWAERSRKVGIQFDVKADIPESLRIEPMELSALFSNAIENAYEACMRISEDADKFIKIETNYNGKRLAIAITNSCLKEIPFEAGFPVSVKKSGGIGTKSMVYTAERFSGTTYFEAKDGIFTARFILNV
jgi:sensor histidine kinase regulating citrate/malate metabolism